MNYLCCCVPPMNMIELYHTNEPINCKIISIHDGDTINVQVWLKYMLKPIILTIRLAGYDCAEIIPKGPTRSKNDKLREKILGTLAKKALEYKLAGVWPLDGLKIQLRGADKYGRVLGTLYANGDNINNYMLEHNFAYNYNGATKNCSTYVDTYFPQFYNKICDKSIIDYVGMTGFTELNKLVNEN